MSNETKDDFITFKGKVYAVSEGEGRLVMTEVPALKSGDVVTHPTTQLKVEMKVWIPATVGTLDTRDSTVRLRFVSLDDDMWVDIDALRGAKVR